MTTKDYKKVFKQLENKPARLEKYKKHNTPKDRKTGLAVRKCKSCGRVGGHIRRYGINLCRQCFREEAKNIGFKKFS